MPEPQQQIAIGRTIRLPALLVLLVSLEAAADPGLARAQTPSFAVPLPDGVRAVWDTSRAFRQSTPTRERFCLNGLWRWQPDRTVGTTVPTEHWGWFKVPGAWPGITDYQQKDFQTVHAHPAWPGGTLASLSAAWYERTVSVPPTWAGRRITLSADYVNSYAAVFVDGQRCGELRFPGGELDLTPFLTPGGTNRLSLRVVALPLQDVLRSYSDSNAARDTKGHVARRGLCGDVFLNSTPAGPRIADVKVDTSVRRQALILNATLENLSPDERYQLQARVIRKGTPVREFPRHPFAVRDLTNGQLAFSEAWRPDALWDIHTPTNQFELALELTRPDGSIVDALHPVPFGYREFWIEGRDFHLNGTRLFLCALPLDNAQVGAAPASYDGARASLERLKSIGINFVYTHNYGCEPGAHLGFEEILRAADDVGMLVALSQPHFSHYDWKAPGADTNNGYAEHARFYVRVAQNHPSVVAYALSHNATGYEEDMNPDLMDGRPAPRDRWSSNNVALALRAEAIVKRLDPSRVVYHHASGNLGSMHTINFYPNFVPIQELSDWFGYWSSNGTKPMFTCEYGAPFTWDWTMYRGWYRGEREFGSARVPWEFCIAEWNAQFLGDRAFRISAAEAANLRWEAGQYRAGKLWHRWDYPTPVGSRALAECEPVAARYFADNWPAFRTWGVSGISPWEHDHLWKPREGVDRRRRELKVDWDHLQRPGFSPDYIGPSYERMDLAFERTDWIPSAAARALLRYNQPLLAYLAGKPARFTTKDHIFLPGETVEKQLIVINNSRETVAADCEWSLELPEAVAGRHQFTVKTGDQERVPLRFILPNAQPPGAYVLNARVRFSTGEIQTDTFQIHVLPPPAALPINRRAEDIAIFDPKGETSALLKEWGVAAQPVETSADLSSFKVLIVGKLALTLSGLAPDIGRVRDGLKVILFEQTAEVLEKRLGFRTVEYGLREVFARVPDHPLLAGMSAGHWRDWRGEATILPARLDYTLRPRHGPTVQWCGLPVSRLWRCGNRGNVASVLIEKPVRGDFLPILDGGYSLQYSPLMEYREGRGLVLFCQIDVTGRTENEPAARTLVGNILRYVADWKPVPERSAVYAGDPAGRRHLEAAGFAVSGYSGETLGTRQLLIVGRGAGRDLAPHRAAIANWLSGDGALLALGLDAPEANALLPVPIAFTNAEHIATWFEPAGADSPLRGIGPADVHNRDPRVLPLVAGGAAVRGDGILATVDPLNLVFCQLLPWEFDAGTNPQANLKRTHRRASYVVTRLLANLGVPAPTRLLSRFSTPVTALPDEKRWLDSFYLDQPEEWDDPYRFFRW